MQRRCGIRKRVKDKSFCKAKLRFKSIVRFLFDNIGNLCSTKKIADTMTSAGRKITLDF